MYVERDSAIAAKLLSDQGGLCNPNLVLCEDVG